MKQAIGVLCFATWAAFGGQPDFHQVDANVYHGRQPSDEGMAALARMGIKTVVDLRGGPVHAPHERRLVEQLGMNYFPERLSGVFSPNYDQIARLMKVLEDPNAAPIFVHCRRGCDRVSEVIACYRMIHDHWTNQQAFDEARANHISPLEVLMRHYILHFDPARTTPATPGGALP
jgi:tyrosine-protein phosphatase SIW14